MFDVPCAADSSAYANRQSTSRGRPPLPRPLGAPCAHLSDATLKINGRAYKIRKCLGEGGFSFVYLIDDEASGRAYALKKILVTSGQEGVQLAMREIEAYRKFKHPNIIKLIDSAVEQDGDGKIVYLCVLQRPSSLRTALLHSTNCAGSCPSFPRATCRMS